MENNQTIVETNEKSNVELLLESTKYQPLNESQKIMMTTLLQNVEDGKGLNESGTTTADIATFTPMIAPIVRRAYPKLIAGNLLGILPMRTPTAVLYALVNQYTGDSLKDKKPLKIVRCATKLGSIALYSEGDLYLVEKDADLSAFTITETYSNEAAFGIIFKNYTGRVNTLIAEKQGKDMKEVGLTVQSKTMTAQSRAMKALYTVEMYQDLQSQHGLQADREFMNLISYEIQAETDRDVVEFVNENARQRPDLSFTTGPDNTGRIEIEKFRGAALRLAAEGAAIGNENKIGAANTLLISQKAAVMLSAVGSYKIAPVDATRVDQYEWAGVAGRFDNQYNVVVDQYAKSDYVTPLFKGEGNRNAMGYLAPYVPLFFTKVTDPASGQPGIIAKTRYALTTTPGISSGESNDRAQQYARSFALDFAGTNLANI